MRKIRLGAPHGEVEATHAGGRGTKIKDSHQTFFLHFSGGPGKTSWGHVFDIFGEILGNPQPSGRAHYDPSGVRPQRLSQQGAPIAISKENHGKPYPPPP